ncbi:MAG: hypothetical protein IKE61_05520 [Coriobacteriales bacterium]|nr:hypothetical protein [Coriobacteriales bacterium]
MSGTDYSVGIESVSDYREYVVNVFDMQVREYEGSRCFVSLGEPRKRKIPNDLCIKDLMSLDPYDEDELLGFQKRYGVIESGFHDMESSTILRFYGLKGRGFPVGPWMRSQTLSDEAAAIKLTESIRASALVAGVGGESPSIDFERRISVSVDEASAAVCNAQIFVSALVEAAKNGVIGELRNKHYQLASYALAYINGILDNHFKSLILFDINDEGPRVKPLMPLLLAQFVLDAKSHLNGEYLFRKCRQCNRWFNRGRNSDEGEGACKSRPPATEYCSAKCQKDKNKHKIVDGKRRY